MVTRPLANTLIVKGHHFSRRYFTPVLQIAAGLTVIAIPQQRREWQSHTSYQVSTF